MPGSLIPRVCAIFVTCGAILISCPLSAQTLSPYSEFQSLTSNELATLQVKVTDVGARTRHIYTLVVIAGGHQVDLAVFRPFYRQDFLEFYGSDLDVPRACTATSEELVGLIDSVAAIPAITDGGVDNNGHLSFSMSVVKGGETRVFESILNVADSKLLFGRVLSALTANACATSEITYFACVSGMLPGPFPVDVTSQVTIRIRGFRKDRRTGQFLGSARITNAGAQAIAAPLIFVFSPPENIKAIAASGTTCMIDPGGSPFLTLPVGASLAPGAHVDVKLRLSNPDGDPIQLLYQRVFAGPGFR